MNLGFGIRSELFESTRTDRAVRPTRKSKNGAISGLRAEPSLIVKGWNIPGQGETPNSLLCESFPCELAVEAVSQD